MLKKSPRPPTEIIYPNHAEIEGHFNRAYDDVKAGTASIQPDTTSVTIKPGDVISFNNGWIGYAQPITKFGYRLSKTTEFTWVDDSSRPEPADSAVCLPGNGGPNGTRWGTVATPAFAEEGTYYYEFGALLEDGTIVSIHILEVIVEVPVFVKVSAPDVLQGESIGVTFSSKNTEGKDWIGIYKKGEDPAAQGTVSIAWFYANSGETAFVPGKAQTETYFVQREADGALAAGDYVIYLFANDGHDILAQVSVAVTNDIQPLNLDLSTVQLNGAQYMNEWTAAGYSGNDVVKFGYDNTITINNVDLTKYSSVTITYSFDANANDENIEKGIIGIKTEGGWYGLVSAEGNYDLATTIAYANMIPLTGSWAFGEVSITIDLSEVTHTGPFIIAVTNTPGDELAMSNILFNP